MQGITIESALNLVRNHKVATAGQLRKKAREVYAVNLTHEEAQYAWSNIRRMLEQEANARNRNALNSFFFGGGA